MKNSDPVMQGFYNNGWKKLEEKELERERLSKLLIEARVKIVELVEGIEIAIHLLRDTGMTNDGKEKLEMIKKLIEKEER